jgi:hypothetical protein
MHLDSSLGVRKCGMGNAECGMFSQSLLASVATGGEGDAAEFVRDVGSELAVDAVLRGFGEF